MIRVSHTSDRAASKRLARGIHYLNRAAEEFAAAGRSCAHHDHRTRFTNLALGLRSFSLPLSRAASKLEHGGAR
jgi:hypothetical protein